MGKRIPGWRSGMWKGTKAKREWHVQEVVSVGSCVKCLGRREEPGWDESEGRREAMTNHPRKIILEKSSYKRKARSYEKSS